MYIKQNVTRPDGNPGIGIQTRDALTLIDVNDIAYMPPRDDKGVVIAEDIILKKDKYPITIYMTPGTVEVTSAAEGDTDQIGFNVGVKFKHPGNEQPVREFKANNLNRKFIIVVRYCSGKPADIIGSVCNPCKMTPSYTGNNEGNTNEFEFNQVSKGDDIGIYRGTVPEAEPLAVVEVQTGSELQYAGEGQYQLTVAANAEEAPVLNAITGGSHDAVITLLGTPGKSPKVEAGDTIMLRDGKTFVATEGSQITLRGFATADGVVWIEQSRYEES